MRKYYYLIALFTLTIFCINITFHNHVLGNSIDDKANT
jgi:hypothetical protein